MVYLIDHQVDDLSIYNKIYALSSDPGTIVFVPNG